MSVDEVADYEDYRNLFKWNAGKDLHTSSLKTGIMLEAIAEKRGLTWKELMAEMNRREKILRWLRKRNIRSYKEVARNITEYYARPDEFYQNRVEKDELQIA
jgi:flagellar protein FlaI